MREFCSADRLYRLNQLMELLEQINAGYRLIFHSVAIPNSSQNSIANSNWELVKILILYVNLKSYKTGIDEKKSHKNKFHISSSFCFKLVFSTRMFAVYSANEYRALLTFFFIIFTRYFIYMGHICKIRTTFQIKISYVIVLKLEYSSWTKKLL